MKFPRAKIALAVSATALLVSVTVFLLSPAQRPDPQLGTEAPDRAKEESKVPPTAATVPTTPEKKPAAHAIPPATPVLTIQDKAAASMIARSKENTKRLYGSFFVEQGLAPQVQEEVLEILAIPTKALAAAAAAAMKSGTLPAPPTPEKLRVQKLEQDEALKSLLGGEGFQALAGYRLTIPDRIIVQGMQREGANLTEDQSNQLLKILVEERKKINGNAGGQPSDSLPAGQALMLIQQTHDKLQATAGKRAEGILSAEQVATLNTVLARLARPIKPR